MFLRWLKSRQKHLYKNVKEDGLERILLWQHSLMWIPYIILFNVTMMIACHSENAIRNIQVRSDRSWFESKELPGVRCRHMELFSCGAKLSQCNDHDVYWCVRSVVEK